MPARNIKVVLAYDGTAFLGWQTQKEGRTVQVELERALEALHKHRVQVHAAGRTDSGVHAEGQVVNFFTDLDALPADRFVQALNSRFPRDLRALSAREVPPSFHSRYDARVRIYEYLFYPRPVVPPHLRNYCLALHGAPSLQRLNAMAGFLVGTHDFTTFSALGDPSPSKVRRVFSAGVIPRQGFLVFRIAASSYLWKMVRSIVGTLLALEEAGAAPEEMGRVLARRERSAAGDTAPARGLFLHRVIYHGEPISWAV